jgi:hypothetical protein
MQLGNALSYGTRKGESMKKDGQMKFCNSIRGAGGHLWDFE